MTSRLTAMTAYSWTTIEKPEASSAHQHNTTNIFTPKIASVVATSEVDKHMMQVCLIGTERGGPFQYARRHHPQRIEYGNRQYRQRERHQSYVRIHIGSDPRPVLQDRDYKNRHDNAHDKRSAVTDEHFRRFAENIMQKKGIRAPTETAAKIVIGASPARKKSVPKIRHAIMQ